MTLPLAQNRAEWLEADGLGGYASGTVCGIRTRRYHALLLAATAPPAGRMVLVNGFDAEIETADGACAISTQRYLPGVNAPDGASRIASFTVDPWPTWTYRLPDGREVTQEIFVPRDYAAVVLRWTLRGAGAGSLRVRPFFSGRDFHALHHANPNFNFLPVSVGGGQRWSPYPGVPVVRARSNGAFRPEPYWYRHFLYDVETETGLEDAEDLAAPGIYLFDLAAGPGVLIFSAEGCGGDLKDAGASALELADRLAQTETARRAAFVSPRLRAADAYLVKRGAGRTIIAGYPWFGDWGRDTFISMRGLCLATGRLREARDILVEWSGTVSEGMLPNRFPDDGGAPEYNSVDASLWYVIVVHEFLAAAHDEADLLACRDALLGAVEAILEGYMRGTRFGIRADTDGLLACGVPGVQLTWMDAKVGDWVVTPRVGKPVEVQALWLNALGLSGPRWQAAYEKGRAAFAQRFWNESRGCLYDVADADHAPGAMDESVRPNQIFAVGGLPLAFFDDDRARRVLQVVRDKLWTPLGPRSLAPGEKNYAPSYTGDQLARDGAYHQGTVWPWLAGPFLEAWSRVFDPADAAAMLRASDLLRPDLQGLNHVPEIADAEPPHTNRGCPFQAWSMGEILRLTKMLGLKNPSS
jgi:predicted glycogen debranching enzyme